MNYDRVLKLLTFHVHALDIDAGRIIQIDEMLHNARFRRLSVGDIHIHNSMVTPLNKLLNPGTTINMPFEGYTPLRYWNPWRLNKNGDIQDYCHWFVSNSLVPQSSIILTGYFIDSPEWTTQEPQVYAAGFPLRTKRHIEV